MTKWLAGTELTWLPVAWEVVVALVVPVTVAAIAALLVIRQIRQLDRHRSEDRQAEAITHLSQMMIDDADTVTRAIDEAVRRRDEGRLSGPAINALDRFRNNAHYVKAQALLPTGESTAVANWALRQSNHLYETTQQALSEHGLPGKEVGPARAAAMKWRQIQSQGSSRGSVVRSTLGGSSRR